MFLPLSINHETKICHHLYYLQSNKYLWNPLVQTFIDFLCRMWWQIVTHKNCIIFVKKIGFLKYGSISAFKKKKSVSKLSWCHLELTIGLPPPQLYFHLKASHHLCLVDVLTCEGVSTNSHPTFALSFWVEINLSVERRVEKLIFIYSITNTSVFEIINLC